MTATELGGIHDVYRNRRPRQLEHSEESMRAIGSVGVYDRKEIRRSS